MRFLHSLVSNTPCTGTRFHRLACGHLVRTSLLTVAPGPCASNCLSSHDPSIPSDPSPHPTQSPFLCPTCYEAHLNSQLGAFKSECSRVARLTGQPTSIVLKRVKGKYDSGVKGEEEGFHRWYDVELGLVRYADVCSESYRWMAEKEGMRRCKEVDECGEGKGKGKRDTDGEDAGPLI